MSTTPIKSAKVRNAVKTALGAAVAVPLMFGALPASAASGQVGDTTFDLSGYVKFDAVYAFEGNDVVGGAMASNAAENIGGDVGDGKLETTVNQTRLRLNIDTPTQFGNVHGYIEGDFYGPSSGDSAGFRRRLAYVQWNGWTIGRIWSTFSDFNTGTTLNFGGPEAQINQRVEGVRYTVDMGDAGAFDVSLENGSTASVGEVAGTKVPGTVVTYDALGNPTETKLKTAAAEHKLPNLAMRYSGSAGIFSYQAAGIVRYNKFDASQLNGIAGVSGLSGTASKVGWGLEAGGTAALDSGTTLKLLASYGAGIDEKGYGYTLLPATNYVDANGDLKNNKLMGVVASVGQKITDQLSTNLVYSWSRVKFGTAGHKMDGRTLAVNLLYSPVKPLVFGIEYSRAYAKKKWNGDHADANVVQFATIYNF